MSINKDTIPTLVEKYKTEIPFAYNYYEVLTNDDSKLVEKDFEGLGTLELRILIKKDFHRKVLMARNNGMKIFDKQNISGTIQFAGVCILKGSDLNGYFREMENPEHTNWQPDRHTDSKDAVKKQKALFKFIKDTVLEIGRQTISDETDAIGAGEFVPDIDISTGADANKTESISNEVKDFSIEKIKKVKIDEGAQSVEELGVDGEDEALGIIEDSDTTASEHEHGDGTKSNSGQTNTNSTGVENENGDIEVTKSISIKPLKLRLFMCDNAKKLYKLSFTPERSANNAYIEFAIAGEQSNAMVEISTACTAKGNTLTYSKNKIHIGNIEAGALYSVLYSIRYNEICSMGVLVHGYKV